MTEDRSVPGDEGDADLDDDIVEKLRRSNPVDTEELPSSSSTGATRTLEQILESDHEPEPEPDESSPSPAAGNPVGEKGRRRVQRRGDS